MAINDSNLIVSVKFGCCSRYRYWVFKRISIGCSGMLTPCQLGKVVIDYVEWIMIAFIMGCIL